MTADDYERFRNVITGMARMFEREVDAQLLDLYWLALRSWPLDEFENTAAHLLGTCRFMPRPVDFNECRQAQLPTAGEAWAQVLDCVKRSDYRRGITPGGAIDAAVQAVGGFAVIGFTDEEKLGFVERRFSEAYKDAQKVTATREHLPKQITKQEAPKVMAMISARTGYVPR